MAERRWIAATALWSLAEATIFFVVPDVIISVVALRFGWRPGLATALAAAIAAAFGGLLVYLATAQGLIDPVRFLDWLPAISRPLIAEVFATVQGSQWPMAMLQGSFSGIPYKLYAAGAGASGTPLLAFILWSIPIRLVRFALIVGAVGLLRRPVLHRLGPRMAMAPLAAIWIGFYIVFWWRMPN
jgi:hypothetical protein